MDESDPTAAPIETRVTPFDLRWEGDQLVTRARQIRSLSLELRDDDEDRTAGIRNRLDHARKLAEEAATAVHDAGEMLRKIQEPPEEPKDAFGDPL